jgi:hypothetical protein
VPYTNTGMGAGGSGPVVNARFNSCQYISSNFYLCSVLNDASSSVICSTD